jgi:hypothetical protein
MRKADDASWEMDDYSALAQRIAVNVSGVRGSLILSRDGLVLGAYPPGDEDQAKPAWLKFVTLGEPEKGFVEFGDQVWAFVKRGSYAAFSVAEGGTRPGILVDQMEQVLLTAEEARSKRDPVRLPDASSAPSGKPRTSLHPPSERPQPSEVAASPTVADVGESRAAEGPTDGKDHGEGSGKKSKGSTDPAALSALKKEPKKLASSGPEDGREDESEVDRVLLAKEFSGLLQMDSTDDEGSS